jgi:hypothetical protein
MLASFAAVVLFCATANNPPNTPTITEPAFDGRVVNPEDVHMETAPFSDPDPGDTHAATDWEIWTVDEPQQVVWAALNITGIEKVHIHLGNGIFQGPFEGRTSLLPNTQYFLRDPLLLDGRSVHRFPAATGRRRELSTAHVGRRNRAARAAPGRRSARHAPHRVGHRRNAASTHRRPGSEPGPQPPSARSPR